VSGNAKCATDSIEQVANNVKHWGYARVSSTDQNLARQLDAFREWGIEGDYVYADKASGKDFERPQYRKLMEAMDTGDVLVIKSIDRLGRNYQEIINEWNHITKEMGVSVVVLDMPLFEMRSTIGGITGTFITDFVLQLFSYVAQIERENIHARQAEGIAAAKARGVRFGRPRMPIPDNFSEVKNLYLEGGISQQAAASRLGCSAATFVRWVKEAEEAMA